MKPIRTARTTPSCSPEPHVAPSSAHASGYGLIARLAVEWGRGAGPGPAALAALKRSARIAMRSGPRLPGPMVPGERAHHRSGGASQCGPVVFPAWSHRVNAGCRVGVAVVDRQRTGPRPRRRSPGDGCDSGGCGHPRPTAEAGCNSPLRALPDFASAFCLVGLDSRVPTVRWAPSTRASLWWGACC